MRKKHKEIIEECVDNLKGAILGIELGRVDRAREDILHVRGRLQNILKEVVL